MQTNSDNPTELEQILDKIVGEADPFHHYINTTRVVLETNLKSALNELLEQKTQQAYTQGGVDELERLSKTRWADLAYDIPKYLKDRLATLKEESK